MRCKLLRFLGVSGLCLGCSLPRANSRSDSAATVRSIAAVIASRRQGDAVITVVDSMRLRNVGGLNSVDLSRLRAILPQNTEIGSPLNHPRCVVQPKPRCVDVSLLSIAVRGAKRVIRAGWYPMGGCGSYEATFIVGDERGNAKVLRTEDEDNGSCTRP